MAEQPTRWGIVGGGVLGMELARRLAKRGEKVTVFEAAAEPGREKDVAHAEDAPHRCGR